MCDEVTETENQSWLARRDVGLLAAGAAASMLMPGCASGNRTAPQGGLETVSQMVKVTTVDGVTDAYFVHPAKGRHPAVLMWPDIAGLREAYEMMGKRLAAAGYAVLVVNQYYRSAPAPALGSFAEWRTDAGQAKLKPMIAEITPERTIRDAGAFVDWLAGRPEVDSAKKTGTCGYCMGGPFTFRTAAARPEKVGAVCSFHGANLVNDTPDSPHLLLAKMRAALLIAIAQNDDERQPEAKDVLRKATDAAKRRAEIEVYPAQHGWCTIDAPVYDKAQAEKAWGRMLKMFSETL